MLAKSKLNSIEVLISKALIDSVISHDEFVLINNVLKKYNDMKKINNIGPIRLNKTIINQCQDLIRPSDFAMRKFIKGFSLFIKQCYPIV